MEISALQALVSDELFFTLHASPEAYTIVAIQSIAVVGLMRLMIQSTALALAFAPCLALGGLAGLRIASLSGLPLGDHVSMLLLGSTAGIVAALLGAVIIARLGMEILAYRKPLTIESRVAEADRGAEAGRRRATLGRPPVTT